MSVVSGLDEPKQVLADSVVTCRADPVIEYGMDIQPRALDEFARQHGRPGNGHDLIIAVATRSS